MLFFECADRATTSSQQEETFANSPPFSRDCVLDLVLLFMLRTAAFLLHANDNDAIAVAVVFSSLMTGYIR